MYRIRIVSPAGHSFTSLETFLTREDARARIREQRKLAGWRTSRFFTVPA